MRRAKVRLTDLTIRHLKPRGARRQVQDADIPGFGVLVTATGDTERSEDQNSPKVHTSLGLRGPFVIRLRGRISHPAGYPENLRR
jgi:hypothetical protein